MEVERATTAAAAAGSSAEMAVDHAAGSGAVEKPLFDALMPSEMSGGRPQFRKVPVPPHRFSPLKRCWMEIYTPVYEHMKVDIRMNIKVIRDHPASYPSLRVIFEHKT
jgi:RNA-binding protein PNO1